MAPTSARSSKPPVGAVGASGGQTIETAEPEAVADLFGRTFPGIRMRRYPDGRPFRLRFSRADDGIITRTVLAVQGRVSTPGDYPDHVAVGRRRRGVVSIRYGSDELDTTVPYLRAPGRSEADFDDAEVELVLFARAEFEARARLHLEGTGRRLRSLDPGRSAPVSPAGSRLWDATADVIAPAFDAGSDVMDGALEDLAVTALLTSFALTEQHSTPGGIAVASRVVRRAIAFMEEHSADPLTVGDIAVAARVSVRTLHAGFHRHLDTTPHRHLHALRLAAARRMLVEGDPSSTSVAEVARRAGFTHLSRFAAQYRVVFGENPAETLRR